MSRRKLVVRAAFVAATFVSVAAAKAAAAYIRAANDPATGEFTFSVHSHSPRGLQAALTFLPVDHPIIPHIRAAVDRGSEHGSCTGEARPVRGGLPPAIIPLPDDGTEAVRAFNRHATEIRIDYVQHSLSALPQYLQGER